MSKAPKISTVLRKAADEHLWDGRIGSGGGSRFSCIAILDAIDAIDAICDELGHTPAWKAYFYVNIEAGLQNMGLCISGRPQFKEFIRSDVQAQGARYAWLHFAADRAEEQGL